MIRSVSPGDLWVLRRKLRSQVILYNEALLVAPYHPFFNGLRCLIEGNSHDLTTFVFRERGFHAYVQAQGRRGRPEQDIVFMAAHGTHRTSAPSDYDIWYRILEQLTLHAGQRQVQRLYAAIWSHQSELHEIFRQVGFQGYMKRAVLQLAGPDWNQGTRLAAMRPQSRQDSWAIHRLYGAVAPHVVQRAEARTARNWNLPLTRRWHKQRPQGWVLGAGDELQAYLYLQSGPLAHAFSLLINPAVREAAPDVLRFGLAQLTDEKPVYLLLSEYQGELLPTAQQMGFQPVGDQIKLIKTTTVPVRQSLVLTPLEPGLETPRIPVPHISVPREDTRSYARTNRQPAESTSDE